VRARRAGARARPSHVVAGLCTRGVLHARLRGGGGRAARGVSCRVGAAGPVVGRAGPCGPGGLRVPRCCRGPRSRGAGACGFARAGPARLVTEGLRTGLRGGSLRRVLACLVAWGTAGKFSPVGCCGAGGTARLRCCAGFPRPGAVRGTRRLRDTEAGAFSSALPADLPGCSLRGNRRLPGRAGHPVGTLSSGPSARSTPLASPH